MGANNFTATLSPLLGSNPAAVRLDIKIKGQTVAPPFPVPITGWGIGAVSGVTGPVSFSGWIDWDGTTFKTARSDIAKFQISTEAVEGGHTFTNIYLYSKGGKLAKVATAIVTGEGVGVQSGPVNITWD
jgi:hypothetical protein